MENKLYKCNSCNYETNKKNNYQRHIFSNSHKIKVGYIAEISKIIHQCILCNYKTERKNDYERHLKSDNHKIKSGDLIKEKPEHIKFNCSLCEYKTERSNDLKKHLARKHNPDITICKYCDIKFNKKEEYENHRKTEEHFNTGVIETQTCLRGKKYNYRKKYQEENNINFIEDVKESDILDPQIIEELKSINKLLKEASNEYRYCESLLEYIDEK